MDYDYEIMMVLGYNVVRYSTSPPFKAKPSININSDHVFGPLNHFRKVPHLKIHGSNDDFKMFLLLIVVAI